MTDPATHLLLILIVAAVSIDALCRLVDRFQSANRYHHALQAQFNREFPPPR